MTSQKQLLEKLGSGIVYDASRGGKLKLVGADTQPDKDGRRVFKSFGPWTKFDPAKKQQVR